MSPRSTGRAAVGLALLACACGPRLPQPPGALPRVERVEPSGTGVPTSLARASVTFSAPVSSEGLVDGRRLVLVPASALFGGAFLVLADAAARVAFLPLGTEPPVGALTAFAGGPLFLWLLRRHERPA